MVKDAYASLRLPPALKEELQKIAEKESRTFSNTADLLLRLGIAEYERKGHLKTRGTEQSPTASGTEDLAVRVARLVVEQLSAGRTRPPNRRPKKRAGARA